jgi:chromosome segregation ATPase
MLDELSSRNDVRKKAKQKCVDIATQEDSPDHDRLDEERQGLLSDICADLKDLQNLQEIEEEEAKRLHYRIKDLSTDTFIIHTQILQTESSVGTIDKYLHGLQQQAYHEEARAKEICKTYNSLSRLRRELTKNQDRVMSLREDSEDEQKEDITGLKKTYVRTHLLHDVL